MSDDRIRAFGTIENLRAKFWDRCDRSAGDDGCWMWRLSKCPRGYGWFSSPLLPGVKHAHRAAALLSGMNIPDGLSVCHRCDNTSCVNPSHLFIGTTGDNQRDKVSKSRQARGETDGNSKLKEPDVREIRRLHASGSSQAAIGRRYGVTKECVGYIVRRQTWRHVTDEATESVAV